MLSDERTVMNEERQNTTYNQMMHCAWLWRSMADDDDDGDVGDGGDDDGDGSGNNADDLDSDVWVA